jgi:hypothetical protein
MIGYWLIFYKYWEFSLFFKKRATAREQKMVGYGRWSFMIFVYFFWTVEAIWCYIVWS